MYYNGDKYQSKDGLKDLLENNMDGDPLYPIIHLEGEDIEVAFTHGKTYGEDYYSFVNGQHTTQGGTHQSAFREFIDVAIWIECDPNVGLERVIKRDGEQIRKHMLSFLVDQDKHFSHERTSDYAHYTLNGAP